MAHIRVVEKASQYIGSSNTPIHYFLLILYRRKRIVVPNHTIPTDVPRKKHPNGQYATNKISTTKYTWWNFLFKNLFQQFKRFANIYFLFIICLNFIPETEAIGKELAMWVYFYKFIVLIFSKIICNFFIPL